MSVVAKCRLIICPHRVLLLETGGQCVGSGTASSFILQRFPCSFEIETQRLELRRVPAVLLGELLGEAELSKRGRKR
jgi:ABC-type uncharacterized transport system permease subunit